MRALLVAGLVGLSACVCHQPVTECTPRSCAEQGKNCGTISDGCDHLLDCGTCGGTELCGGAGPNLCGDRPCLPTSCATLQAECGLVADGCASVADCGECPFPLVCGAPGQANRCVSRDAPCTPKTCAQLGAQCGVLADGCGHELDCGSCAAPGICSPAGRCLCNGPGCERNEWATIQADSAHTGFNPIEDGIPPLTLRWFAPGLLNTGQVVSDGRTAVTVATGLLHGFDVADGGALWSHILTGPHPVGDPFVGQPAFFDGRVFLSSAAPAGRFWAIDPLSGQTLYAVSLPVQYPHIWAPIRLGEMMITNGGINGGMYGFDANTGAQLFFKLLADEDEWSPATDGTSIFTALRGRFEALDLTTGATWHLILARQEIRRAATPVVSNGLVYVVTYGEIFAIDTATRSVRWSSTGQDFKSIPAVANGVVYAINRGNIHALDALTGTLRWTFVGDGALSLPPVLTRSHLYVSSDTKVFAVDLATHAEVWSADGGGWLSIANGTLFVAGDGLSAYALTPP